MRQRLAKKQIGQIAMGELVVTVVKQYAAKPELLKGVTRQDTLFLWLSHHEDQHMWYVRKQVVLDAINEKLRAHGYKRMIRDIRYSSRSRRVWEG